MGISRNLRMYLLTQKYMWKDFATYRVQTVAWLIIFTMGTVASIITISVIYSVSKGISGWSYYQMLVISALANMLLGIVEYNISSNRLVSEMRNGQFDQRIVKPYNPVLTTLAFYGKKVSAGSFMAGLLLFIYAAYMTGMALSSAFVIFVIFIFGAISLQMFILMLSFGSYVLFNSGDYIQWITSIAAQTARYPLNIYGLPGTLILTVVLPVGLASFYSSALVFGKISITSVAIVILIEIAATFIYYEASKWLIKKYRSGGG